MKKQNKVQVVQKQKTQNERSGGGYLLSKSFLKVLGVLALVCVMTMMFTFMVSAEETEGVDNTAETLWEEIANLIQTWVTRIGGVIMFIGAVLFVVGWRSDDGHQKNQGLWTLAAGAMAMAIGFLVPTFFGI